MPLWAPWRWCTDHRSAGIYLLWHERVSAYVDHAQILGKEDEKVCAYVLEGLAANQHDALSLDQWVDLPLKYGRATMHQEYSSSGRLIDKPPWVHTLKNGEGVRFAHQIMPKGGQCYEKNAHKRYNRQMCRRMQRQGIQGRTETPEGH